MTPSPQAGAADAAEILFFTKGGRDHRLRLLDAGEETPREFFYGFFETEAVGRTGGRFRARLLSSAEPYAGAIGRLAHLAEQAWSRASHLGLRLWYVRERQSLLSEARLAISFTDGFSLTLGNYYRRTPRDGRPFLIGGFHGLSDIAHRSPAALSPAVTRLIARGLAGLDHVFFFGPADRDYAIARYRLDAAKTSIFRFGVDTDFWRPAESGGADGDHPRAYVLAIGQDPNRDYDTLAAAATARPIRIVTRQPVRVPPGRGNVAVTAGSFFEDGALTDAGLRRLYQEALAVAVPLKDVYQPTGYSVTLQAMACSTPVILSRIRGLWTPELLRDGENCLLVPPGDAAALGAAIERLATDAALCRRLGEGGRSTVLRHFDLAAVATSAASLVEVGLAGAPATPHRPRRAATDAAA
jgi:glycosyltransferase involved in cell wall biosynthesis